MLLGESYMKVTIRGYRSGDESGINDMFNEIFGQSRDISHWYWKYRDNPYGSYGISLAVAEDGTLAAHYSGYPVKIYSTISGDRPVELSVYQLGDKMTRKGYRSEGFGKSALIARAYRHFVEAYTGEAVPFCYGFAAHHSLRFGVKVLKYADIEPIPYRRIPMVRLKGLSKSRVKRIFAPARVSEASSIGTEWTDFFLSVAPHYGYLVRRDAPYLIWRYLQRPDKKYSVFSVRIRSQLSGWSVFFREGRKVVWGDALFRPGDVESVKALLGQAASSSLFRDADFVECWFPPRPQWWESILNEIGFEKTGQPDDLHFTVPIYRDSQSVETVRRHLYYSIGDSDLF